MIYKKQPSTIGQYISLLKEYYHVSKNIDLLQSLISDFLVSLFMQSGSGLFTSVFKGIIGHFFIKSGYPLLIGRRFRLVHPSNIIVGHHIWIRDDVAIIANGNITIGNDFVIGEKSEMISNGISGIKIGNNVGIGKYCYVAQLGGPLTIGNNVLIADSVRIHTLNHKYTDIKKPILHQGYEELTIVIKDNVWIGSGTVIFNNVTIGKGCVIGANTVVNKNVPDYAVFTGNPGKIIKRLGVPLRH